MVRRKFSYNLKNILFITDICTSMSTSSTGPFFVSKRERLVTRVKRHVSGEKERRKWFSLSPSRLPLHGDWESGHKSASVCKSNNDHCFQSISATHLTVTENQIKCDLLRTMPNNERFRSADCDGVRYYFKLWSFLLTVIIFFDAEKWWETSEVFYSEYVNQRFECFLAAFFLQITCCLATAKNAFKV